jgi:ribosomal protein S17
MDPKPESAAQAQKPAAAHDTHGFRRKMIGRVLKAKMTKTVVVEVVTHRPDAL